jgi:hypothetical protein
MQIRDPIEELKTTKLFLHLDLQSPEYAEKLVTFVSAISPSLRSISTYFPYYTRHDPHHGFRVTRRMDQIIFNDCLDTKNPKNLRAEELFLLIAAAYAHDLGMAVFDDEKNELLKSLGVEEKQGWETNPYLQRHLRMEHSRRGGEFIKSQAISIGIPVPLIAPLDLLMKSHNYAIHELERIKDVFVAGESEMDIRQLATIVCIADAIEFSETRVVDGVLDLISEDKSDGARVSYLENMKHVCIGDSLSVDDAGTINVSGSFSDENVLALAHKTFDEIEQWIRGYCDIERQAKERRLHINAAPMIRNLQFTTGRFERLGVRLNKKSIIDLISSNSVWRSNGGIAIRELLQNSVEACRYRLHHSSPADKYSPQINVVFDRALNSVTVSDNGCGMSERVVLNHFLTVGQSRAKEKEYSATNYTSIARFGIGFWSVFTIAQKAEISTAAFEDYRGDPEKSKSALGFQFSVSLDEMKDYTVFKANHRKCGCEIVLTLKDDVKIDDLMLQSRSLLLCSEIPISFTLDYESQEIPRSLPQFSRKFVLKNREKTADSFDLKSFIWEAEANGVQIALHIFYTIRDGKATFLIDKDSSVLTLLPMMSHIEMAVCGFSTQLHLTDLIVDLSRVGKAAFNALSPSDFQFSIDRNTILSNARSRSFQQDAVSLIYDGYRAFLKETASFQCENIFNLNQQSRLHGGEVFDRFTKDSLSDARQHCPDLLCFCLIEVSDQLSFKDANRIYVDLTTLMKMEGVVWCMHSSKVASSNNWDRLWVSGRPDVAASIVYEAARTAQTDSRPRYVIAPSLESSILFDADGGGSILSGNHPVYNGVYVQEIALHRIDYQKYPQNLVADVSGQWSGTVYQRDFSETMQKPYVFLGRHRVVVKKGSRLLAHLTDLAARGMKIKLSETIHLLSEDEEGHPSSAMSDLLK